MNRRGIIARHVMPPPENGHFQIGETQVPFTIARSERRRRTISFYVCPEETLRILAPMRTGFGSIQKLIHQRSGWIGRRLTDVRKQREQKTSRRFENGEGALYLGTTYALRITEDASHPSGCRIEGENLVVSINGPFADGAARREEIRLELLLWYKKEARRFTQQRIDEWSARLKLRPRRFFLTNAKRLWGSCSGQNDVRINWRLIMAPLPLLDYVIVHELCHIAHKNHSARFWRMVEQAIPGCMELRRQLRALGPNLTL